MKNEGVAEESIPTADSENLVYICRDGVFIGAAEISDTVKPEAAAAVQSLYDLGVEKTLVLSGDKAQRAEALAKSLGIKEAYGDLLPEDKYKMLETELSASGTMYVGDGINDAPSLALADVGVAMGGMGSDSAREAADLVIVSGKLSRIPEAISIARKTVRIAKQNIVFALGIKLAILVLGAVGIANMWIAVFADVGVAVLAILNAMRALIVKRSGE
jgi:Cd2+/Zn2+-exporting ATPase